MTDRTAIAAPLVPGAFGAVDPLSPKLRSSETLVEHFYKSLSREQKGIMAFPFDHPLRDQIDNNWHITKARVGTNFSPDQQAMIREIFNSLRTPDFSGS